MTVRPPSHVASWITLIVGLAGFTVVAAIAIPWNPVPGGSVAPAVATDFFTAAEIDRGEAFARWARVWGYSSLAVSLVLTCALGFTDLGARAVGRLRGPWWLRVPVAVAGVVLVGRLVTLPFAVAMRIHVRDYGLSRQPWSGFARDLVISRGVVIVTTSLALLALIGCARRWERTWPAAAGVAAGGLVLLGSLVYPVVIEPLFNSFTPLPQGALRAQILDLAERQGVSVDEVLVADASRRTTTLNAYVSGFGATRRVVLYDTLVEDLGQEQTLSVVAHELAHARHDDVLVGSVLGAAGAIAAVGALGLLLGTRRLADPGSVPRVLALVAVATLLTSPIQSALSRQIETRADVESLAATDDPAALIALQQDLARRSAADLTPPALTQWWFGSHPTTLERIGLARK
jgi:STE24 endopeptidase